MPEKDQDNNLGESHVDDLANHLISDMFPRDKKETGRKIYR